MEKNYYVYCYYDSDWNPLYIGLGKNQRGKTHLQPSSINNGEPFHNKLLETFNNDDIIHYRVLKDNITRQEASIVEEAIVTMLGRKNNNSGILYNQKEGGISAPSDPLLVKVALYDYNSLKLLKTFKSISECARYIKGNKGTVGDALRGKYSTSTSTGTYFLEEFENIPNKTTNLKTQLDVRKKEREKNLVEAVRIPVKLKNVNTNEILNFRTSHEAKEYLNCCTKTLKKCFETNKLFRKEWKVFYGK